MTRENLTGSFLSVWLLIYLRIHEMFNVTHGQILKLVLSVDFYFSLAVSI